MIYRRTPIWFAKTLFESASATHSLSKQVPWRRCAASSQHEIGPSLARSPLQGSFGATYAMRDQCILERLDLGTHFFAISILENRGDIWHSRIATLRLHELLPPEAARTLITRPGSNALFSILPLQFT